MVWCTAFLSKVFNFFLMLLGWWKTTIYLKLTGLDSTGLCSDNSKFYSAVVKTLRWPQALGQCRQTVQDCKVGLHSRPKLNEVHSGFSITWVHYFGNSQALNQLVSLKKEILNTELNASTHWSFITSSYRIILYIGFMWLSLRITVS